MKLVKITQFVTLDALYTASSVSDPLDLFEFMNVNDLQWFDHIDCVVWIVYDKCVRDGRS